MIVGGRSEDQAHSGSISNGNTYYDRRSANNFGPPWFPTAAPQPGRPRSRFTVHYRDAGSWQEINRP